MLESVTQFTENYLNKKSDRLQKAQTFFSTKAVQSIPLRHRFVIYFLQFFCCFSAPLSRLAPIEALTQAPTGLCPVPFARFARGCFYFVLVICSVWRCHSSLLTKKLCSLNFEQICRSAHSKRYSCCNNDKVALLQIAKLHRTLQSVSDEFVSVCFLFDNACSDTP